MKNNKGFAPIAIALIIVAVLAVGGVVYYVGKSSAPTLQNVPENNNQSQVNNNTVQNNTLAPTTDKTANWKTYTNTKYGFEVKYPENYSIVYTSGDSHITFRSTGSCKSPASEGGEWPIDCQAYDILIQKNSIDGLEMSKIFIDGIQAEKFTDSSGMWSNGTQILVQFQKGQNWYIQTFTFNQSKSQTAEGIINQILSTFKFTNSSSEDSLSEILKNQPGEIKSITVKGSDQWVLAVDLLTRNPNWTPGGELPFFLNQNPKIRNLNVTNATKTHNCDGVNPNFLVNTSIFISDLEKASYKKAYFDINGSNITAIYQQCLP